MASLTSKIKSAASSAAKKVTSSYSNATKQLQALGSSLNKPKAVSTPYTPAPNRTNAVTGKSEYVAPAPKATSSKVADNKSYAPNATSAATKQSYSTVQYPNGAPSMTSVATGKSVPGSIIKSGSGSRGGNNMLANAYGALTSALGSASDRSSSQASDGRTDAYNGASSSYSPSTYKGTTGSDYKSYSAGQGQSLEAQGLMASGQGVPTQMTATPESRTANRGIVSTYEAGKNDREAQIAALTAQRDQLKSVYDSLAASQAPAANPNAPEEETEDQKIAKQIEAMEREMDKLNEVPKDVLAAQREEEALLAEEARIKDQMNQSLYGIKGQAIPQGFITGQGARVQDLANVGLDRIAGQKVTLQQRMANAAQRRAAAMDVVREKSNRLYDRRDTLESRSYDEKKRKEDRETQAQKDRYQTIGDGAQLYDTVTGKIVENSKNYSPKSASQSSIDSSTTASAGSRLQSAVGGDGYTDPNLYARLRAESNSASEFDRKFGYLVNPASKARLGLDVGGGA